MEKKNLYEVIAHRSCCYYLFELKTPRNKAIILDTLSRLNFSEYSLKDLSDVANYITDIDCNFRTETEARYFFAALKLSC